MNIKLPLKVGGNGAWLYDADGKFLADFTHSKYTCEQVRENAKFVADISAQLSEAQARLADEWLPIATAPKDQTAILVMRDIWPGTKSGRAEECNGHNTYVAEWWGDEQKGEWTCYMDQVHDPRCPIDPTHWRPLPTPPSMRQAAATAAPSAQPVADGVCPHCARIVGSELAKRCAATQQPHRLKEAAVVQSNNSAGPLAAQAADVCRAALEDACVVSWISADLSTIDGAKRAIASLCAFDVQLATDPATNGGKVLVEQAVADDVVRDAATTRALRAAVSAIYFDDGSDYGSALWTVVAALGGNEVVSMLEENDRKAYLLFGADPESLDDEDREWLAAQQQKAGGAE